MLSILYLFTSHFLLNPLYKLELGFVAGSRKSKTRVFEYDKSDFFYKHSPGICPGLVWQYNELTN